MLETEGLQTEMRYHPKKAAPKGKEGGKKGGKKRKKGGRERNHDEKREGSEPCIVVRCTHAGESTCNRRHPFSAADVSLVTDETHSIGCHESLPIGAGPSFHHRNDPFALWQARLISAVPIAVRQSLFGDPRIGIAPWLIDCLHPSIALAATNSQIPTFDIDSRACQFLPWSLAI